jgi:diguanylate cyclase (GGDEF)-like protein
VAESRPVIVTDALADESTALIARSYRPEPRFYAGVPLITEEGFAIGALAVLDPAPREMDERCIDVLLDLASQVMSQLELRRQTCALAETVRQLRDAERSILRAVDHDALTGLPGRSLFDDRLEHALRHAVRYDETLAVMFVDLDGFKAVNDTCGHAAGDKLLQSVANALQSSLRRSDTVARIGGDEFALVCPDIHDAGNASIIAGKLLQAVCSCHVPDGVTVTASIGISVYPYDGANAETLLSDADTAMYRAKRRGRNTFAFSAMVGRKG